MEDQFIPTTLNSRRRLELDQAHGKKAATAEILAPEKAAPDAAPTVGGVFAGCRLVAELGRGASGRVFLAQQATLADRPLVLKVTTDASREEQLKLARLQHTHIMPLYWATSLPSQGMHVLAMPYLARTTLATLLTRLEPLPRTTWTGQRVFELLEEDQASLPVRIAVEVHPAQILKRASWVDFVVRTGQILAEALAYAHQREILHLDLKPANVLITPDGQPILLDLDVARPPISAGTLSVPWLGGTPEFTSPEQRAAMEALTNQQPIPRAVDGRSDLYSLALILYHALGGDWDAAHPPRPLDLPRATPHVSQGLADILARCLAEDPAERYPDGYALADDLRRHLSDLPLRGVRNRLGERWRKWRRHRPLGLPLIVLLAGFCLTAAAVGFSTHRRNEDRRRQAEAALVEGQESQRRGQHEAAIRQFLAGKELAEQTYGADLLAAELTRRANQAQRLQRADELGKVVHLMRYHALQEHTPVRLRWVLESAGRKLWADRHLLTDRTAGMLEQSIENDIQAQLLELLVLWADLHVQIAPPAQVEPAREKVRGVLAEAEQMFGSSFGLGLAFEQQGLPGSRLQPREVWEFCALGRIALARGDHAGAARHMQAALDRDPLGFVPNFYFGVCALRQKKPDLAARAFSFCAGQDPRAECFLLRGQALAALGETDRALKDFNHALDRDPQLASAYQHRGELYRTLGRAEEAERDLRLARKLLTPEEK